MSEVFHMSSIEEFTVRNVHRIGVISDTHIPDRMESLPSKVYELFQGVDLIIHAGDAVEIDVIHELRSIAEVIAVHGNMCRSSMSKEFPYKGVINVNGFKIGVVHGHGCFSHDIQNHLFQEFERENVTVDCIVFGHTHVPLNVVSRGVLLFNPGSACVNENRQDATVGILHVGDKQSGGKITGEVLSLSLTEGGDA